MPINTPCLIRPGTDNQASYEAAIAENSQNALASTSGRNKRAVGDHTKYWKPGRTLTIAIFRYDEKLFNAVKNSINEWQPYVNLNFEFIELPDNTDEYQGDIRIELIDSSNGTGSSRVGTDALTSLPHLATMTLGTNYTSPRFAYTAMHEFGHALGLVHEHQHPAATIPWDVEKTYRLYQTRYGWTKAVVDQNVLALDRQPNVTYAPYDTHSVMHYGVSNEFTHGNWEQAENTRLSPGDIAFVQQIYPR